MLIAVLNLTVQAGGITPKPDKRAGEIYEKGIKMLFTQNVGQIPDGNVVFYTIHPSVVSGQVRQWRYTHGSRTSLAKIENSLDRLMKEKGI